MNSSDTSLLTFKAISNFVNELNELFGDKQRSLKLYARLINKTTIAHDKPISKHISAFKTFCVTNRDDILNKNVDLKESSIRYSEVVYIDITSILKLSDTETSNAIWNHILTLSALVDPAGRAKEVLKDNMEKKGAGATETNFLTDIISKVGETVDPEANPMQAVSAIMQSGIFTELLGGMNSGLQNGSLDLGKLMGAVQGMVSTLSDQVPNDGSGDDAMNMLSTMMGGLTGVKPTETNVLKND
jgi:hypothetical protein